MHGRRLLRGQPGGQSAASDKEYARRAQCFAHRLDAFASQTRGPLRPRAAPACREIIDRPIARPDAGQYFIGCIPVACAAAARASTMRARKANMSSSASSGVGGGHQCSLFFYCSGRTCFLANAIATRLGGLSTDNCASAISLSIRCATPPSDTLFGAPPINDRSPFYAHPN